jgi:hypothetical protein
MKRPNSARTNLVARPAPARRQVPWPPAPRTRSLATAALLALLAAVLTGHAALLLLAAPALGALALMPRTDLRRRGFPLIVVDTLRDEPPADPRSTYERLTLRLWRLDRAATRSALRDLGVPVLRWPGGTELDSVLAPLRRPPPGLRRLAARS